MRFSSMQTLQPLECPTTAPESQPTAATSNTEAATLVEPTLEVALYVSRREHPFQVFRWKVQNMLLIVLLYTPLVILKILASSACFPALQVTQLVLDIETKNVSVR